MDTGSLQQRIRGRIARPGAVDYEARRSEIVWNQLRPPHRPEIIVAAVDEADVIECVRFARAEGLRVAVRGGGHNWCGAALQPGSLLLDLSGLREVRVDASTGTATAQPGVQNRDLCRALSKHGFAFPYGHCPTVALSGYVLSGGFGWNSGSWGPACFNVHAAEIVTAAGERILADETHHPDYYWAVRGAGSGFFGVVTRYHLMLHPLPRAIAGSTFVYPLESAPEVATWLGTRVRELPNNVEIGLFAASAPAGLGDPKAGMFCIVDAQAFADTPANAASLVARLEEQPPPAACLARETRKQLTYEDLFDATGRRFPERHRYLADTFLTNEPAGEVLGAVRDLMRRAPSPRSLLLCVIPPPPPADAPPPPDMAFSIGADVFALCYAIWDSPEDDDINRAWHGEVVERLERVSTGHYIGEADLGRPTRAQRSFAPANWERLQTLRERHDPGRLFHSALDGQP